MTSYMPSFSGPQHKVVLLTYAGSSISTAWLPTWRSAARPICKPGQRGGRVALQWGGPPCRTHELNNYATNYATMTFTCLLRQGPSCALRTSHLQAEGKPADASCPLGMNNW